MNMVCYFGIGDSASPRASGGGGPGDDGPVGGGPGADGLLDEPGEAVADALGGAAVEPEHVLVGGGRQVLAADRAVVGAQEPALGEAEDDMDAGQRERRLGGAGIDRLVDVAPGREAGVAGPAVGGDGGGLGDGRAEEPLEARGRGVGRHREPEPAEAAAGSVRLDGAGDQRLAGGAPAALAG